VPFVGLPPLKEVGSSIDKHSPNSHHTSSERDKAHNKLQSRDNLHLPRLIKNTQALAAQRRSQVSQKKAHRELGQTNSRVLERMDSPLLHQNNTSSEINLLNRIIDTKEQKKKDMKEQQQK